MLVEPISSSDCSKGVERPGDPFASLDFATLGSAHIVSGLNC